jgi:hypothetical protein
MLFHFIRFNVLLTVHHGIQYTETNVRHFLFNFLRIKGLYMFRTVLTHPQQILYKRHLVYCVSVVSYDCYQDWSGTEPLSIKPVLSSPILLRVMQ